MRYSINFHVVDVFHTLLHVYEIRTYIEIDLFLI